jgi:hypothetical protein
MLRLDPGFPPLWRSPTTLQFGLDAVAMVEDPEPWQQRLIRELEHGIPEAALEPIAIAFGAPEGAADAFVRGIERALLGPAPPRRRIAVQSPHDGAGETAEAVARAFESTGIDVDRVTWFGAPNEAVPAASAVVVLAHHLVEPRRASVLMGADVPHVPLVFTGAGAEVGPFIVPGRTPCLACIAAHRRDADPAWPHLAAQLLGRRPPEVHDALAVEAALVVARLISEAERSPQRIRCHSLTVRENSLHRSMRVHRPHAACRCRSLGGTATAVVPAFPATRTATAFARPA